MAKYKIGQIMIAKADIVLERELSGAKVIAPKGSKVIIGADGMGHHFRDGSVQPIAKDATLEGYDAEGLALYLYTMLNSRYDLDYYLENQDCTKHDFMESIAEHLREVGFCE